MDNTWNIPDWRKREDYPDYKSCPLPFWRWEFSRRNPEYREDYQRYIADRHPWGRDADGNTLEEKIAFKYGMYELVNPRCWAADLNQEVFFEAEPYFTEIAFQVAREAWSAERSPKLQGAAILHVPGEKRRGRLALRAYSLDSFNVRAEARGHVLVSLDPLQPLEPQFVNIKKELEKEKEAKVKARARVDTYELALRLLDARSRDSGEPEDWKEIQRVITKEPHRGTLTKTHLQRKHRDALKLQKKFVSPFYRKSKSSLPPRRDECADQS